ncbi:MAG: DUF2891 domain-containing protein [Holophagales bacterium]|jgi:hypothetical protein|nr:DUF2891 domain-containing protein [Holophagales bacterium]
MFIKSLSCSLVFVAAVAQTPLLTLNDASASHFAKLALRCVGQEFPNKPDHVLGSSGDLKLPKELHPAFYGCYDWHSSVHGHWMLARLLRHFPNLPEASKIQTVLDRHLTSGVMKVEVDYLDSKENRAFERPYGWAWLLKLSAELETSNHSRAKVWADAVRPLAKEIRHRFMDFLPKLTYPNRTGVHSNTAYSMSLALDYARAARDTEFEALLLASAKMYFSRDKAAPLNFEPSGEDFISPTLEEAALMAKVLSETDFKVWLKGFLPNLKRLSLTPAEVSDRSDPRIAHLDGLNMSRARNLYTLMNYLPAKEARAANLADVADTHANASLPFVASGNYEGEHWLATFAVHMLEARGKIK